MFGGLKVCEPWGNSCNMYDPTFVNSPDDGLI
jgi:hypothetical protein